MCDHWKSATEQRPNVAPVDAPASSPRHPDYRFRLYNVLMPQSIALANDASTAPAPAAGTCKERAPLQRSQATDSDVTVQC